MAKGNDGNYLQHCIELEAAVHLAKKNAERRLHIALAHGMAPFEAFEVPFDGRKADGTCHKLLKKNLADSKKPPQADEPVVVKAYRKTLASDRCYPNSAELLKAAIGAGKLSGGITETCLKKHKSLSSGWLNTSVKTACASWRQELHPEGILACPGNLQTAWLFTMDPMSYIENGNGDDDYLHRCDIGILSRALSRYFNSGNPGVAALFVYGVGKQNDDRQYQFWKFVTELREHVVDNLSEHFLVAASYFSLPHRGGNRNMAGLIHSSQIDLSSKLKSANIEIGIAPARSLATRL